MMLPAEIYSHLEMFDSVTAVPIEAALALHAFVKKCGCKRTMEVGLAFGASAAYTIAATLSRHVAIDCAQSTYWQNLGVKNLDKLGFAAHLELLEMPSHAALPQLAAQDRRFDFIFIDGNHRFDDVLVDFILSDCIIEKQGYIVLDDMWMPSIRHVASFIRANRSDYVEVTSPHPHFAAFRKIAEDRREWTHFVEFCTEIGPQVASISAK